MDETLVERLRGRLERDPDVVFAYLFGSHARGRTHPLSDVDVAVSLAGEADAHARHLDLIGAVAEIAGTERADVVVLNDAPIALAYRVLRDGRLLFSRDEKARIRHWVNTVDRYIDMAPMRRELARGLHHRLREGRFGRP